MVEERWNSSASDAALSLVCCDGDTSIRTVWKLPFSGLDEAGKIDEDQSMNKSKSRMAMDHLVKRQEKLTKTRV